MSRESLIEQLLDADEDDVEQALEGTYAQDALGSIAPDVLLEFFRQLVGVIVETKASGEGHSGG